jgi:hypothetical protein
MSMITVMMIRMVRDHEYDDDDDLKYDEYNRKLFYQIYCQNN